MSRISGEVEAVSTKFGKFSVLVGGVWYGTDEKYTTSWKIRPEKGDVISFDTGKTGKYLNNPNIIVGTTGESSGETGPANKTTPAVGFPIEPNSKERAIIRQNSLTHATAVVLKTSKTTSSKNMAEEIIEIARLFETYSSGADEYRKVMEAMEAEAKLRSESTETSGE